MLIDLYVNVYSASAVFVCVNTFYNFILSITICYQPVNNIILVEMSCHFDVAIYGLFFKSFSNW